MHKYAGVVELITFDPCLAHFDPRCWFVFVQTAVATEATDAPRSSGQAGGGNVLVADVSEKSKPKPIIAAVVSDNEVLTRAHRSTAARRGAMYRIPTPNGSVRSFSPALCLVSVCCRARAY